MLEKMCARHGLNINRILKSKELEQFAKKASYEDSDAILSAIGYGKLSPLQVIGIFVPHEHLVPEAERKEKEKESILGKIVRKLTRTKGLVKVSGYSDMLVSFGKCCNPVPGDSIVGFVTRGRGVSVHVTDCPKVVGMDPTRKVEVDWDASSDATHIAKIRVVCADRPGLLASMTEAITSEGVNISAATIHTTEDQTAVNDFELEIKNSTQLRDVMKALERLKGIISVQRVRGG
jgi:GTP pyrophosphokinase